MAGVGGSGGGMCLNNNFKKREKKIHFKLKKRGKKDRAH